MNEDYFTGFEKSYIFFDDENEMMISFGENGIAEISIIEDVYVGKWRFLKTKQLIEIFIEELQFKIIYKMKIMKEDKEKEETFLLGKYVIKYNEPEKEDKKGSTTFIRTVNNIKMTSEEKPLSKIEQIITFSVFIFIFLFALLITSFIPVISDAGLLYSSAIILVLQILLINKIKKLVKDQVEKHENLINNIFYN